MTGPIDLDQIEKKAWASFYEDGFLDVVTGLLILVYGLGFFIYDMPLLTLSLVYVTILIPPIGRKFITYPRRGRVKLGFRLSGKRRATIIWTSCVVIAFLLMSVPWFITNPHDSSPIVKMPGIVTGLIMGLGCLVLFGSIAYASGVRRNYVYGLLMAVAIVLAESLDNLAGEIMIWASGVLIVLIGLALLVRFLHKYPRPVIEDIAVND